MRQLNNCQLFSRLTINKTNDSKVVKIRKVQKVNIMADFRNLAKRATTLSEVMTDREKVTTDQLIEKYPNCVTIVAFDYIQSKKSKGMYPVFNIAEDPTVFCNGGTVLDRIFKDFIAACDGDISAASNELRRQGGLAVKLSKGSTKSGDDLTVVEVL